MYILTIIKRDFCDRRCSHSSYAVTQVLRSYDKVVAAIKAIAAGNVFAAIKVVAEGKVVAAGEVVAVGGKVIELGIVVAVSKKFLTTYSNYQIF